MRIGFIGLGNLGSKLAGSLLRNGFKLAVSDLNKNASEPLLNGGAFWEKSPKILAQNSDLLITCLPSPEVSAEVMEMEGGVLDGLSEGKIWAEMSTTDEKEVKRLGELVSRKKTMVIDCPVSGGCHRALTGNISIFVGGERIAFEKALPALRAMGRLILHTGPLGSASILKVISNYLATSNLVTLCEALTMSKASNIDLKTAFEAIRISSGNSFVHETETKVILNGSRNINFTIGLVLKDLQLFEAIAQRNDIKLEILPILIEIFKDGQGRFGPDEWSPNIIRRLEEKIGCTLLADGFPAEIIDKDEEVEGYEVFPKGHVR